MLPPQVLRLVESGENVFFTGSAGARELRKAAAACNRSATVALLTDATYSGTGKSFLLREIISMLPKGSTHVTAATGIAACPLGEWLVVMLVQLAPIFTLHPSCWAHLTCYVTIVLTCTGGVTLHAFAGTGRATSLEASVKRVQRRVDALRRYSQHAASRPSRCTRVTPVLTPAIPVAHEQVANRSSFDHRRDQYD